MSSNDNASLEVQRWRERAEAAEEALSKKEVEFDEFQKDSREYEAELEGHIEQVEQKYRRKEGDCENLLEEFRDITERLTELKSESLGLQEQLSHEVSEKQTLRIYIRQLEQKNDDLERAQRATVVSLEDFEGKLNAALEKNAMLESERDEKADLEITVQRLKDEARDLRQEYNVRIATEQQNKLTPPAAAAISPPSAINGDGTHTHATRVTALNIVSELLRRIGAVENKVASVRTLSKPRRLSPLTSPRNRTPGSRPKSTSVSSSASSHTNTIPIGLQ